MNKPILRWTLGHCNKNSISVLRASMKSAIGIYDSEFYYFVLYNEGVEEEHLNLLKNEFKHVGFVKQKWSDFPFDLKKPKKILKGYNQIENGSFWKLCPPRFSKDTHEIVLDNDVVFLRRPKIIDEFLSRDDKNLIVEDAVCYLGSFQKYFRVQQGYNAGVIGLHPGYNFDKKKYELVDKKNDSYGEEQGFTIYSLYVTNPLIGSSKNFVGLHSDKIFISDVDKEKYKKGLSAGSYLRFPTDVEPWDVRIPFKSLSKKETIEVLKYVFSTAESIHFLGVNRYDNHFGWNFFKSLKKC